MRHGRSYRAAYHSSSSPVTGPHHYPAFTAQVAKASRKGSGATGHVGVGFAGSDFVDNIGEVGEREDPFE